MLHQKSDRGPWSATASGRAFYPADPRPEDVNVLDIARSLANTNRFNGMFRDAGMSYSVAEHAVRCVWIAMEMYPDLPRMHYWALHHDSEEAYTGDIITQMKAVVPGIREAIAPIKVAVVDALDLWPREEPEEIKEIDTIMFATERLALMADTSNWTPESWGPLPDPWTDMTILGDWSVRYAETMFLAQHCAIRREIAREEAARVAGGYAS